MTAAERFLALHQRDSPLLMPNPWDAGSAKLLEALGFEALATTSGGSAATLGRLDGSLTRDEAIAHAAAVVAAVDVPVSADLEDCFADDPDGVAETVGMALDVGLAGCSVEDWNGTEIYARELAAERVAAAAEAAHGGPATLVLTARCESYLHGDKQLDGIIARLTDYQQAGADVLFAPGLKTLEQIRVVIDSVDLPVSFLVVPGAPSIAELAAAGISRVSVGSTFAYAALGATVEAARELREQGTYGFYERAGVGFHTARPAFAGGSV